MADNIKIPFWQWLPIFHWRIVGVVESADDIPQQIPRNGVILVGTRDRQKWIAFDCPCRRGHRIMLNTDKARVPCWSLTLQRPLTISPSIDYSTPKQRCHYFIQKGRIVWV